MPHRTRMTRSVSAAVVIAITLLLLAACSKPVEPPEVIRPVRTLVVALDGGDAATTYPGEVVPRVESRLGFRVGGKLIERRVDVGQAVRAGEVLARLDVQDLALAQTAAKAQLDAANTNLALAQSDLARYRDLFDRHFIGKAELDRRQATFDGARAQQEQAAANYRSAANQAGYAGLAADAAGVVTAVDAEVGQVVAAGTPVVRVARTATKEVAFTVPENRIDALRSVRGAQVSLWALPGRHYDATVREIAAAADPATRTYAVRLTLKQDDPDVHLGMTAVVRLDGGGTDRYVRLPLSALAQIDGKSFVWVLDEKTMTVHETPVALAGPSGTEVVVAQGLNAGQRVVTAGANLLQSGQKVKLLEAVSASADAAAK